MGLLLACAACGGRRGPSPTESEAQPLASIPLPLSAVYLLEQSGTPPNDTVVTFTTGQRRIILLRAGPPDNSVLAEVQLSPDAFADTGSTVEIRLRPRPGIFGVDLETSRPFSKPARLTFKYALHFSAPADARRRYGSDAAFERALSIGQLKPGDTVTFLPSVRPASDNLEAMVAGPGSYVVGAPR
jgi:hypothetical protein